MNKTDNNNHNKPANIPVFSPKLCNILLNNGYNMASVSRNKRDNKSTVFYFKPKDGLNETINEFIASTKTEKDNSNT